MFVKDECGQAKAIAVHVPDAQGKRQDAFGQILSFRGGEFGLLIRWDRVKQGLKSEKSTFSDSMVFKT